MTPTNHTTTLTLPARAPLRFAPAAAFVRGFHPLADSMAVDGEAVVQAMSVEGKPLLARLAEGGDGVAATLTSARPMPDTAVERASELLTAQFSLDEDLTAFYEASLADAAFAPVREALMGYHQVRFPTPFEAAVWPILSSRSFRTQAVKRRRDLLDTFGDPVPGSPLLAFPEAPRLAPLPWEVLDAAMHQRKRAQYVIAAAEAFARVDPAFLAGAPDDEVEAWLLGIPGIGPWSAEFVMLRGLGRMDRLPRDKSLLRAAAAVYRPDGGPLDVEELERLARPYGVWRGYWAHYLRVYEGARTQG